MWLQDVTQFTRTTQFVAFAQAVLYCGARIEMVWLELNPCRHYDRVLRHFLGFERLLWNDLHA